MADAETATASAAKASRQRIENQMARVEAERIKAANMLATAQHKLAKECASGRGSRCHGRQATVAVYEAAVKGHNADLARLSDQLDGGIGTGTRCRRQSGPYGGHAGDLRSR